MPPCDDCGALHFKEERVGSGAKARFTLCCSNGRTKDVPRIRTPPVLLELLGLGPGANKHVSKSQHDLRNNVRRYNCAMAFVSFCDAGDATEALLPGPSTLPVYVLHGQAYHSVSTLLPSEDKVPRYGQVWIFDPQEATEARARVDAGLDKKTLLKLDQLFRRLDDSGLRKGP